MNENDPLRLESQLCFPLYAGAKEVVRLYTPLLNEIGLTYTQYLVMMVLWENKGMTVKELGSKLFLDTGTLTPLLKRLEKKKLILRERDPKDERSVVVNITNSGMNLRDRAVSIPDRIGRCVPLSPEEAAELYRILYKILNGDKSGK